MNREIKFRAWRPKDEDLDWEPKMIYDDDEMDSPGYHIGHFGAFDDTGFQYMQFTGLKDKNGKEIYEGDIVRFEYYTYHKEEVIREVEWDYDRWDAGNGYPDGGRVSFEEMEVIGNIYENRGLLNDPKT